MPEETIDDEGDWLPATGLSSVDCDFVVLDENLSLTASHTIDLEALWQRCSSIVATYL